MEKGSALLFTPRLCMFPVAHIVPATGLTWPRCAYQCLSFHPISLEEVHMWSPHLRAMGHCMSLCTAFWCSVKMSPSNCWNTEGSLSRARYSSWCFSYFVYTLTPFHMLCFSRYLPASTYRWVVEGPKNLPKPQGWLMPLVSKWSAPCNDSLHLCVHILAHILNGKPVCG